MGTRQLMIYELVGAVADQLPPGRPRRQFAELVRHMAAPGGRRRPPVGEITRRLPSGRAQEEFTRLLRLLSNPDACHRPVTRWLRDAGYIAKEKGRQ